MIAATISIIYKKQFLLSILIALESILLKLVMLKIISSYKYRKRINFSLSLFLITLSAIEASIGISILALISRKLKSKKIYSIKLLKK